MTLACNDDFESVMTLIKHCIGDMESHGIFQWNDFYPSAEIIRGDIESRSMHILKDGIDCIGMIVINEEQSPEYEQLRWTDVSGRYLIIHRLAVSPEWQRKGVGQRLMDCAENFALERNYTSIRLDAYTGNPRALALYERRGYEKAGQLYFPRRELPFNCYEKMM